MPSSSFLHAFPLLKAKDKICTLFIPWGKFLKIKTHFSPLKQQREETVLFTDTEASETTSPTADRQNKYNFSEPNDKCTTHPVIVSCKRWSAQKHFLYLHYQDDLFLTHSAPDGSLIPLSGVGWVLCSSWLPVNHLGPTRMFLKKGCHRAHWSVWFMPSSILNRWVSF